MDKDKNQKTMPEQEPATNNLFEQIEEEVDDSLHPILEKIVENIKVIGAVIGGIILIVSIYAGIEYYQKSSLQQAQKKLGQILVYSKQKTKDLEEFAQKAPAKLRPAIYMELAKLYVEQNQVEKGLAAFKRLENLDEDIKPICVLGEATLLSAGGKYKQAYQILQSRGKNIPKSYEKIVLYKKAFLAERCKDFKAAYLYYNQLKNLSANENLAYLNYKLKELKNKL